MSQDYQDYVHETSPELSGFPVTSETKTAKKVGIGKKAREIAGKLHVEEVLSSPAKAATAVKKAIKSTFTNIQKKIKLEDTAEKMSGLTATLAAKASKASSKAVTITRKVSRSIGTKTPKSHSPTQPSPLTGESTEADLKEIAKSDTGLEEKTAPGKILKQQFIDGEGPAGKLVASQEAERFDTVPFLMAGLETKLAQLEKKHTLLSKMPPGEQKTAALKKLEEVIEKTRARQERYQKSCDQSPGATWVSVAAPETLFKHSRTPEEARERYLPGLTNLRVQRVWDAEGKVISSINRSGAITDFSHNEVSLQELQDYTLLLQMRDHPTQAVTPNVINVINRYTLGKPEGADHQKLHKLVEDIEKNTLLSYSKEFREINEVPLNPVKLQEIIKEREEVLSLMFLQDLSAHLKNQPAKDKVLVGRSSLVAMDKPPRIKGGVAFLSERTQGFDMSAIYEKMNDKILLFDLDEEKNQQAYIDEEGKIHLPKQLYYNPKTPPTAGIKLQAIFCNASVQAVIENTGPQKAINDHALGQLHALNEETKDPMIKEQVNTLLKEMQVRLNELEDYASWNPVEKFFLSPDPFPVSLNFQKVIQLLGGYGSVNCYGGVDRTGYLVELKTNDALKNELMKRQVEKDSSKLSSENTALLHKWGLEQLSDDGIAIPVGKENKGHKAMKLARFMLDLYSTQTDAGLRRRILHASRAALVAIPGVEHQEIEPGRPDKLTYHKWTLDERQKD